jgi:hypothetical protein
MNYIQQHFNVFSKEECEEIYDNRVKYSIKGDGSLGDFLVFENEADLVWEPIINNIKIKTKNIIYDYMKKFLGLFPLERLEISHIGFLTDSLGSFTEIHYDWELVLLKEKIIPKPIVIIIYLNDDFEGGELLFPVQNFKVTPKQGSIAIFPCNFAFPHVSQPVTKGTKNVCRVTFKLSPDIYKVEFLEI